MKKTLYLLVALGMLAALIVAGCSSSGGEDKEVSNAKNSVVWKQTAASLAECGEAGGVKVQAGIDLNGDGKLDDKEITSTDFVCNGAAGAKGDKGDKGDTGGTGTQGPKGDTGDEGSSGKTALVAVVSEPDCTYGGKKVVVGVDDSKDGILQTGEITDTAMTLCNDEPTPIDGGYIGTDACLGCHDGSKAKNMTGFLQSGHPYKYTHTGGAIQTATIPGLFTRPGVTDTSYINTATLNNLRRDDGEGLLDWSAVNYTIGGYGWKLRWGVKDNINTGGTTSTGYIWAGDKAQYNMRNDSWSAYNANTDKKYECAVCHNTNGIVSTSGYSCETDGGSNAFPARTQPWAKNPGMGPQTKGGYYSSWTFDGVQCEACHGPGEKHAKTGATLGVLKLKNGTVEICAKCHIRATNTTGQHGECGGDSNDAILTNGAVAKGDWISHHETYNELVGYGDKSGKHYGKCTTCHDPHKRSTTVVASVATLLGITDNDKSGQERGAVKACTTCHSSYKSGANGMKDLACIDCHMAEATKSATNSPTTGWGRKADLKTHIFKINPSGTTITTTNADGKTIATNYITPRYACGKCHDPAISTEGHEMTEAQAQSESVGYHSNQSSW